MQKIAVTPIFTGVTAILLSSNCQRRDFNTISCFKQRLKLKKATDSDSKIRNTVNGLDEQCKHCH